MPKLAWRNDADGFAFSNSWSLDAAERAALTGLVPTVGPAALAVIGPLVPPDPALLTALGVAVQTYLALGANPAIGLCGGMSYASLDYWHARAPLPRGASATDQPARNAPVPTAVRNMIWARLLDSLRSGGVLQKTLEWSLILNQVPAKLGGGPGELLKRTKQEFTRLQAHIDAGEPWPIGLVWANNTVVWDQHQIVVYGYEFTGADKARLYVYDCNFPSQYGDTGDGIATIDLTGATLVATEPSDNGRPLAGFFCSDYNPIPPPGGLVTNYGTFLSWSGDPKTWMIAGGARMPVSGNAELAALGGTVSDVRPTGGVAPPVNVRPRDGTLLRERSAVAVFLYQGGAPFGVPDPNWLDRFGGVSATQFVPDATLNTFVGLPDEGTLLREWSDPKVYRIMAGQRRWVLNPAELAKYGGPQNVRVVPDGALASIPEGTTLPPPAQQLKAMNTIATPSQVHTRRSNQVTITASDAQSGGAVSGNVWINGKRSIGNTGSVTIPWEPTLFAPRMRKPPTMSVRAPGYKEATVMLRWQGQV